MKKLMPFLSILAVMLMACSITVNVTPPPASPIPPATNLPVPSPSVTQAPTAVPIPTAAPANASCSELSLYLDPALASGSTCETIPESSMEMEIHPQYTELTLQGYVLGGKFFPAHISIYPVQRYSELLPDFVPGRVTELQTLIGGGSAPVFAASFGSSLPLLPVFNAGQVFYSNYQVVPFVNGSGIRFLTEYAQYTVPVNNSDLFYTYQGLTSDGQNWISAILPVNHPLLPADGQNPPGGLTWEDFSNNYEPYITDMSTQLNAQAPDSFTPTLTMLDALIASIIVQP
jgi:hypothetical protein